MALGQALPSQQWIPPGIPGADGGAGLAFDPEAARHLLAQAGFPAGAGLPELRFPYTKGQGRQPLRAAWLATQFATHLGITLIEEPQEPSILDTLEISADSAKEHQLFPISWCSPLPDPHTWLGPYWHSDQPWAQRQAYHNPAFDQLVQEAQTTVDPAHRLALAREAHALLIQDAPAIFLITAAQPFLIKPWIKGLSPTPLDGSWPGAIASLLTLHRDHTMQ